MTITISDLQIQNECKDIYLEWTLAAKPPGQIVIVSNIIVTNNTTGEAITYIEGVDYTVDGEGPYSTTIESLTTLPDGVYTIRIEYFVEGSPTVIAFAEKCILSTCILCCQVKTLASKVVIKDCGNCNEDSNKDIMKFLEADALLTAIRYGGKCGVVSEINKNIENLQEFLSNINCKNC
jgi:hypothetical protein